MKVESGWKTWKWSTRFRLLLAGWRPSRNVWSLLPLPKSFDPFPEARRVLSAFGGLNFGTRMEHVRLDPTLRDAIAELIERYENKLGIRLYPLGVMEHQDRHYLLIDQAGIVYTLIDELEPLASSFERAIEYLIQRTVNRHVVERDLKQVGMYGKLWRLESSET